MIFANEVNFKKLKKLTFKKMVPGSYFGEADMIFN